MIIAETSRDVRKRKTRDKILRIAYEQFSADGITKTKTLDVARQAEISHGGLFVHFSTREELVVEVLKDFGKRAWQEFSGHNTCSSNLRDLLQAHLDVVQEFEAFYCRIAAELPLLPKSAQGSVFILHNGISHHLQSAFMTGVRAGKYKKISAPMFFNSWISLLYYYLGNKELFTPRGSIIEARGSELLEHFITLIEQ